MQGFDYERAKTELSIPSDFDVNAMIAIGRRAPAEKSARQLSCDGASE
jgi:hypothetical protein